MSLSMEGVAESRWLKLAVVLLFVVPPVVSTRFDPIATPDVVQAVLSGPIINDVPALVVAAKFTLLAVTLACLLRPGLVGPLGWGYYAGALTLMAVGQNIAHTPEFGWAWLIGNTLLQLLVAAVAAADAVRSRTKVSGHQLHRHRLWVVAPMVLAWLFPYSELNDRLAPSLSSSVLINESGLTYCMVTPVILGLMILYSDGVHRPTLTVAAWVGLVFGITNTLVWFVLSTGNWWMGILHIPLLVLSTYALWLSRRRRGSPTLANSRT